MAHVLLTEATAVVGMTYWVDVQAVAGQVQEGSVLHASFNPLNAADANAIGVFLQGKRLGHIDAGCASRVAELRTDNAELSIEIITTGIAKSEKWSERRYTSTMVEVF